MTSYAYSTKLYDSAGAELTGSTVELVGVDGLGYLLESRPRGLYTAPGIPQGIYRVKINGQFNGQSVGIGTGRMEALGDHPGAYKNDGASPRLEPLQSHEIAVQNAPGIISTDVRGALLELLGKINVITQQGAGFGEYSFSGSAEWVIDHQLPIPHPQVTTVDSGGSVIIGDVIYDQIVPRRIRICWSAPITGTAFLS